MNITLEGIGKRFNNREWVVKNLDFKFKPKETYAITGNNGSGKSTLTKIISGISPPSKGKVYYENAGRHVDPDNFHKNLTYAAPYLDLVEELTLVELLDFHFKFKSLQAGLRTEDLIDSMYLTKSKDKQIGNFSSGMKQRLKLGLALFSQASVTILDEPTSNMDETGIAWYSEQIKTILGTRMLIIASNQPDEYRFAKKAINLDNHSLSS